MTYRDKRGYEREHSDAVHRHRAYHHIYLKDRKKYPLPFEAYEVHHIDGDKTNNKMENLAVLTPEEHDKAHELMDLEDAIFDKYGITSLEEYEQIISYFNKKFGLTKEELFREYEKLKQRRLKEIYDKKLGDKEGRRLFGEYTEEKLDEVLDKFSVDEQDNFFGISGGKFRIMYDTWEELKENLKEEERQKVEEEERRKRNKERNEKIKSTITGFFKKKDNEEKD